MKSSIFSSSWVLAVATSTSVGVEGWASIRGHDESDQTNACEHLTNEIGQPRTLGHASDNHHSMLVLQNNELYDYCLSYEVTGTMVYPNKKNEDILGLVASICDPNNMKQRWVIDSSRKRAPIRPLTDLSLCIENIGGRVGHDSARLVKCEKGNGRQRMRIAEQGSAKGAIQTQDSDGWGRSLSLSYFNCPDDQYRIVFDRRNVALWDQLEPDNYRRNSLPELDNKSDGDHVLVVSEYDMNKCVRPNDLKMKKCDTDNDMLTWFTDGSKLWSPKSQRIYDYNWNDGIARGECCLEWSEYWLDGGHVGPLFEFGSKCESGTLQQGFLLVPVDQYAGPPDKLKDIQSDDYVQLQVDPNNMCLTAAYGTEVELSKCDVAKYNIADEQLWYVEKEEDGVGTFRLRSKKDLSMCLDFGVYVQPYDDFSGYKMCRLSKCNEHSDRQDWRYNKKGNSEISHVKVPGYLGKTFCITSTRTCRYSSCDEDEFQDEIRIASCNGYTRQIWNIVQDTKFSKQEASRKDYPKRDYFLFVSKEDEHRCWERDVTENMGLVLNYECHMTIPRRHNSQIFYFEETEKAVRIKMRNSEEVCMGVQKDKMEKGACIDMFQTCDSDHKKQEWMYNKKGDTEISPLKNEGLCVSSDCRKECGSAECGERFTSDCGHFCLRECSGKDNQGFDAMNVTDYRKQRDYGQGIDADDIVMVVLKEDPKYCIKAYDTLEKEDIVVAKCKADNAEEHWAFETTDKGTRWRSVENPHLYVESTQSEEGEKLILNEDRREKNRQHWKLEDGNIRPAWKRQLCVARNSCRPSSPAKNENMELVVCDKRSKRMEFDLVRPSKYAKFLNKKVG